MRCRAMVMAPRLLTRRSTWTGSAAGWGGGPAGRAPRMRASSEGVSGLGRLRSSMPSWTSWSKPWPRRTVRRRPARSDSRWGVGVRPPDEGHSGARSAPEQGSLISIRVSSPGPATRIAPFADSQEFTGSRSLSAPEWRRRILREDPRRRPDEGRCWRLYGSGRLTRRAPGSTPCPPGSGSSSWPAWPPTAPTRPDYRRSGAGAGTVSMTAGVCWSLRSQCTWPLRTVQESPGLMSSTMSSIWTVAWPSSKRSQNIPS